MQRLFSAGSLITQLRVRQGADYCARVGTQKRKSKRKATKSIRAAAVIAIIVAAFLLLLSIGGRLSQMSPAAQATTPDPRLLNASIGSFATPSMLGSVFGQAQPGYYAHSATGLVTGEAALMEGPCYGIGKALLAYSPLNFSTATFLNASIEASLDKRLPIVITSTAVFYNIPSITIASLPPRCRKIAQFMNTSYGSSFYVENITGQVGADARLYKISNLTDDGLFTKSFAYSGARPQLTWYVASFTYRSVEMNVGIFMFSQYANDTKVIGLARAVYLTLLGKAS